MQMSRDTLVDLRKGIMKFGNNGRAKFWDVFGLSLGLKAQLL